MYPKKCNKLALCQISQIVRVWVMKVWVSKYFEPPSVSHQAFPSNSESFPSNLESSVIFGAHSGEHGTRCVWNRWDLKFYVNSCVKMSSAHVSLVTCGIFPCEPNLDWRVTISKVWGFRPRVILSFSCSLRWAQILSCSDDFPWTQPILKGESFKFRLQGSTQMHVMPCCASFQSLHLTDCILFTNIKTQSWLL